MSTETKSDAVLVKEFTEASGFEIPLVPQVMSKNEVKFIVKMILDETMELYATVAEPAEAKQDMIAMITESKDLKTTSDLPELELIAEQNDAFIDIWYYSLNCAAKKGTNLSKIFNIVHQANMDKRDPESGLFERRADGKIIKPKGWKEPDITGEIKRQSIHGPFTG